MQRICILGGSGFIGRHVVAALARRGIATRVLTRHRHRARHLLVFPNCELVQTDIHYTSNLSAHLADCDAAINMVGVLHAYPGHGQGFEAVHAELPGKLADACLFNRVRRLIHISALNASNDAHSQYLRTKAIGERAVLASIKEGIKITIFQPSVVFGPGDKFLNRLAKYLTVSPFIFPLIGADTRFAPVYVGNVVEAITAALSDCVTYGQCYSLCGPNIHTLEELVKMVARSIGVRRLVLRLPNRLAELQARIFEKLPVKLLTTDNLRSMQKDCVCEDNGLLRLGINPVGPAAIVPHYLHGGCNQTWNDLRVTAGRDFKLESK